MSCNENYITLHCNENNFTFVVEMQSHFQFFYIYLKCNFHCKYVHLNNMFI
jgi:hypothetical protein